MKVGLTNKQVIINRKKYGTNKLPEKKLKTGFQFFMETFKDKLNQILLGMMILLAVMAAFGQGSYSEPIGVAIVLLVIALINMRTGLKSQRNEKELKDRTSIRYCNVIRDGKVEHINVVDLVVGDRMIIQAGEAIYADGYLVAGDIKVDNSVLNGESEPCKKVAWTKEKSPIPYGGERKANSKDYVNYYALFAGTTVIDGGGEMIVTNVGVGTVNGQTLLSIDEIEETKTSLQIQIDDLVEQISKFGYIGASTIIVALIAVEIVKYGGIAQYFNIGWINVLEGLFIIAALALTTIIAAVPEGLPLIINLITAQNVKKMIKKKILAKHTNKIPEAGNVQLLCTDKTGTLTVGKLVPVENVMGNGEILQNGTVMESLFKLNVALNNNAMYDDNKNIVGGNATERALLTMISCDEYKTITESTKVTNRKVFNSQNKYSAIETKGREKVLTYYKGAPEKLIDAAMFYETEEGIQPIEKEKVKAIVKSYAEKAMRVIATAYNEYPLPKEGLPNNLILTSLVAIRDDVRPEVPEAVRKMHTAGVQVMMVTGDVIETAEAIARDAGLITSESDIAMPAIEFDALSDEEAKAKLPHIKVIARATPNTKLRIVRLAQELGLCVGMTGDGTNDAPALKAADVGFSMGSGTDVCKEAGDINITDDNFASITSAVLLGRTFMHNVMKFLKFQLPINISLVILNVLYPIFLLVEALIAAQILVVNIVMDSLNSLSYGGEPAKEEYMKEKPIPKGSKLLSKKTLGQIAMSTVAFLIIFGITLLPPVQNIFGNDEAVYATVRFALLIMMATFNGFNIRTDGFNLFEGIGKNKLFIKIAIGIFAGTFILAQFGGDYIGCTAMTATQWLVTVGLAFMIIPIDLLRKVVIKIKRE